MALVSKFEHDGVIYDAAYIRVSKIRIANVDYEQFVDVDEPDHPEIAQRLQWIMRIESSATAFVWVDKDARDNRAMALKWFEFDFNYDLDSDLNVFQQVYNTLKSMDRFADAVDV